jgi:hypothetical protein
VSSDMMENVSSDGRSNCEIRACSGRDNHDYSSRPSGLSALRADSPDGLSLIIDSQRLFSDF